MEVVDWCGSQLVRLISSYHFDGKQYGESLHLPLRCRQSLRLTTFDFWSSEVGYLYENLHPNGGTDPLGMFPPLLKRTDVLAPCLNVVFQWLVSLGSFLACWRGQCHSYSEGSTILLCCQLQTDFHNISIVFLLLLWWWFLSLSGRASIAPEEKQTVIQGMPQVKWSAYVM